MDGAMRFRRCVIRVGILLATSPMKLLDLFCGEGGASVGYMWAGFEVFGVDLFHLPAPSDTKSTYKPRCGNYPFECEASDVLRWLDEHDLSEYDAIHASPPCQHASAGTRAQDRSRYPRLIEPVRERLQAWHDGLYVIENVQGSALVDPVEYCGCMFDMCAEDDDGIMLWLQRTRLFESNLQLVPPSDTHTHDHHEWVGGSYGGARRDKYDAKYVRKGGYVPPLHVQQELLGINWMTERGMYQSIPPMYTYHIGQQLMQAL